jgi:cell division protein FtsZ
VLGREVTLLNAFKAANDVLQGAVQGIADLITAPGLINVDFADVRTVMSEMGLAMMGSGTARGDDRAQAAAEAAIKNPLLEDVNLNGACGILVNVTAGPNLTMREFDEIGRIIHDFASEDATVVMGTSLDPEMKDDVRVTVVATGLNRAMASRQQPPIRMVETQQVQMRPRPVVLRTGTGNEVVDYAQPEMAVSGHNRAEPAAKHAEPGFDYLDIPAFLRRQAD